MIRSCCCSQRLNHARATASPCSLLLRVTWQSALARCTIGRRRRPADDGRARNTGGLHDRSGCTSTYPSPGFRRHCPARSSSRSSPRWHPSPARRTGPSVPAAGVGTKAALNSPQCDNPTAGSRTRTSSARRALAPLKKGESNGGATVDGRHRRTPSRSSCSSAPTSSRTPRANQPGGSAPVDHATGPTGVHRGLVPRLAGGARPQLQPVGPQVRVRHRAPRRDPTKPRNAPTRSTSPR